MYDLEDYMYVRKMTLQADVALLDLIKLLEDDLASSLRDKAEKVYCYCNIKGSAAIFRSFYTKDDTAFDLRDTVEESEYAQLETKVVEQLELMRRCYSYCTEKMPSELFLDYDTVRCCVHALKSDNGFTSVYDAEIRFKAWLEEHGGTGRPIGPRIRGLEELFVWKFFKKGEEKAENPTAGAVEIDIGALRLSRKKAEKLESPSASQVPLVYYNYLEGDTGFLALKAAFDEFYPEDKSPDYLYYQDVDDLSYDFKLVRKHYEYTLFEYVAVYEDEKCRHIVSIGMSEMGAECSRIEKRYDAEYTMRIPKLDDKELDEAERANAINLVSILADEAYNKDRMLEDYSYVSLGFRKGVDYRRLSDKVAFIIVPDARISSIDGPFGPLHLRQAVPITRAEYNALKSNQIDVKTLYEKIGTDLVDYDRPSVI